MERRVGCVNIDELGKEREKEDGDFRVQNVDKGALHEDPLESEAFSGLVVEHCVASAKGPHSDPREIRDACPLDQGKGGRGLREDHGQPEDGCKNVDNGACVDADGRDKTSSPPLADTAGKDVYDGGPWNEYENKGCEGKKPQRIGVWHWLRIDDAAGFERLPRR